MGCLNCDTSNNLEGSILGMPVHRKKHIKLSVVVPCYNEEMTLERCLRHVLEIQDDSLPLEIIIVDDSSTDSSLKIAQELAEKHPEVCQFDLALLEGLLETQDATQEECIVRGGSSCRFSFHSSSSQKPS